MWDDISGDGGVRVAWQTRAQHPHAPATRTGDPGAEFLEMQYELFALRSKTQPHSPDTQASPPTNIPAAFDEERVDSSQYPLVVMVGEREVVAGLDLALAEMRSGDHAHVLIDHRYGYGSDEHTLPPGIMQGDTLRFEIRVRDVRPVRKLLPDQHPDVVDLQEKDRLDQVREERELAAHRRAEEKAAKEEKRKLAAARAAAMLAGKGQKKGSKKKK